MIAQEVDKFVLCARCMGNSVKHDLPFWGVCYLCGGVQHIPEALAAAYRLFSDGLGRRPTQNEVAQIRHALGWDGGA
jgi:hypothetical protein